MAVETAAFAGAHVSRLIKGGWQLHDRASVLDRKAALRDMAAFAAAGITTVEAADCYDGVEALIGDFRAAYPDIAVRVHTRLTIPADGALTARAIAAAVASACVRLRSTTLDLLQLSLWRFDPHRWRAAAQHAAGLPCVAALGVMNVDVPAIATLAEVPIVSVQAQFSLLDRRAESTLLPFCRATGRAFLGYGALAGGFLSDRWLGRPDPGAAGHAEFRAIIEEFGGWPLFQRLLGVLSAIAHGHACSISNIALRWALDRPGCTALLVGASDASHLPALSRLAAITLSADDHALIDEVLANSRGPSGPVGGLERDPDSVFARAIAARSLSAPAP